MLLKLLYKKIKLFNNIIIFVEQYNCLNEQYK